MGRQSTTSASRVIGLVSDPKVVWRSNARPSEVARGSTWLVAGLFSVIGAATLAWSGVAWAQGVPPGFEQRLELYQRLHESMPDTVRDRLSGSGLNLAHVMAEWEDDHVAYGASF